MTIKNNKRRGYNFEKEVVRLAHQLGVQGRRAWGSNGRSMGYHEEVDGTIGGFPFQAKIRKRLPAYLKIPRDCKATVFRQDRDTPKAVLELTWYLELIKVWQLWWELPANAKTKSTEE